MEPFVRNKLMPSVAGVKWKLLILCLVFLTAMPNAWAQNNKPVLERTITLQYTNERTGVVLNSIAQQGAFSFSYNPAILDPDKLISGNFHNKPVREILNSIFAGKLEFRERKGYIILQKAKQQVKPGEKPETFIFSGYVRDESGVALPWVSIYDKASLESTVSNDYGFYRIKFSAKHIPLTLFISKQGYIDTTLSIAQETPGYTNLVLRKNVPSQPPPLNYDSLSRSAENTVETFFSNLEDEINALNIKDTLYRKYQVSFLPFIGTNLKLSGNVINDYSFNVFGGISMGTRKAELAGFFNLNKSDVSFLQVAGFANMSGGHVYGTQLAGFVNLVKKDVSGIQLAGFVNGDMGAAEGVQMAGFVNVVKGKSNGAQAAGFVNAALDSVTGAQLSGFCNVAGNEMIGIQVSGFCNVVGDTLSGGQLGFINYAKHLNGLQLGFINYSNSTTGFPLGFISYVNDGYHKIELAADEILPVNIAFRSGINSLHNILTSGLDPFSGDTLLWNFGYGLGTSLRLSKKTFLDFDLTSSQMVKGNNFDRINLLNKAYLGIDTRLAGKLSLAFGVTLNGQLTNSNYSNYPDIFSWYEPNIFYDRTWASDNTRLQMWLGGKIALRFL